MYKLGLLLYKNPIGPRVPFLRGRDAIFMPHRDAIAARWTLVVQREERVLLLARKMLESKGGSDSLVKFLKANPKLLASVSRLILPQSVRDSVRSTSTAASEEGEIETEKMAVRVVKLLKKERNILEGG